ncbi:MAG: low molecular weight phosphatase family protein [Mycobacterium sp.]
MLNNQWAGRRVAQSDRESDLNLLFVCTGNICRSPTAERLAAAYGVDRQIPNFVSASAGTRAVVAHPMHRDAALVLRGLGGDASAFAARQLNFKIAAAADLILTMTREHRDKVLELAPHKLHRTFTLVEAGRLASEFNPRRVEELSAFRPQLRTHELLDIADPIDQGVEEFSRVGAQIADLLPPILELCRQSSEKSAD